MLLYIDQIEQTGDQFEGFCVALPVEDSSIDDDDAHKGNEPHI